MARRSSLAPSVGGSAKSLLSGGSSAKSLLKKGDTPSASLKDLTLEKLKEGATAAVELVEQTKERVTPAQIKGQMKSDRK